MEIKEMIGEKVKEHGLSVHDAKCMMDLGLITEKASRDFLIKEEYQAKISRMPKNKLKDMLAIRFGISFHAVQKIVATK